MTICDNYKCVGFLMVEYPSPKLVNNRDGMILTFQSQDYEV